MSFNPQDLVEQNTLFDDLFKNLENNNNLYDLIYAVQTVGESRTFEIDNSTEESWGVLREDVV